jgi:hypothetical protein
MNWMMARKDLMMRWETPDRVQEAKAHPAAVRPAAAESADGADAAAVVVAAAVVAQLAEGVRVVIARDPLSPMGDRADRVEVWWTRL